MSKYSNILDNLTEKPPRGKNDHIVLIDAMNTLIRSFTLVKTVNPDGHHIGGLIGFLRSLGYINRILDPTRIIVVWDGKGGSQNRKNLDPNYKAQREHVRITNWGLYDSKEEESDSLTSQIFRVMDYLYTLPVQQILMEKLEADDTIAYIAQQASASNKKVTIVSSDKDFLQLIDKNVCVYSPIKKVTYDYQRTATEIGMLPENYNILKALVGDNSDNLAGVKGAGPRTLIKEFSGFTTDREYNLEKLYKDCEEKLGNKKIFAKILHSWDRVETNFELMDLHKTSLSEKEQQEVQETLRRPIPDLQVGAFLRNLDMDKIEGITKNTDFWLEGFRNLTLVK